MPESVNTPVGKAVLASFARCMKTGFLFFMGTALALAVLYVCDLEASPHLTIGLFWGAFILPCVVAARANGSNELLPYESLVSGFLFSTGTALALAVLCAFGLEKSPVLMVGLYCVVLIATCVLEARGHDLGEFLQYETLVFGILTFLAIFFDVHMRQYLYAMLFYFMSKSVFVLSRNILCPPRILLRSLLNSVLYFVPLVGLMNVISKQKMDDKGCRDCKTPIIPSLVLSVNITHAIYLIINRLLSFRYPSFGFDAYGVFVFVTLPSIFVMYHFFMTKKYNPVLAKLFPLLILIPFFPYVVFFFLGICLYLSWRMHRAR